MRMPRFHLHNPLHSQAPAAMKMPKIATTAGGGNQKKAASNGIASSSAVMIRCLSMPRRLDLLAGQTETSLTSGVGGERAGELGAIEIRPRGLGEIKLG